MKNRGLGPPLIVRQSPLAAQGVHHMQALVACMVYLPSMHGIHLTPEPVCATSYSLHLAPHRPPITSHRPQAPKGHLTTASIQGSKGHAKHPHELSSYVQRMGAPAHLRSQRLLFPSYTLAHIMSPSVGLPGHARLGDTGTGGRDTADTGRLSVGWPTGWKGHWLSACVTARSYSWRSWICRGLPEMIRVKRWVSRGEASRPR